jgi:cytochrome c6
MSTRRKMWAILSLIAALLIGLAAGCGSDGEFGGDAVDEGNNGSSLPVTMPSLPTSTQATSSATETGPSASLSGDPVAGKNVFAKAGCGSCHTLQTAGSEGQVGPNLDDASPSYDHAVERVTDGKGRMPSFRGQLSETEIRNVAAYVSESTKG